MINPNPITINGEEYSLYCGNLAITLRYNNNQPDASVAMRLVPACLKESGESKTLEDQAKSVLIGSTLNITGPEQVLMQEINDAVQKYINVKNV